MENRLNSKNSLQNLLIVSPLILDQNQKLLKFLFYTLDMFKWSENCPFKSNACMCIVQCDCTDQS